MSEMHKLIFSNAMLGLLYMYFYIYTLEVRTQDINRRNKDIAWENVMTQIRYVKWAKYHYYRPSCQ